MPDSPIDQSHFRRILSRNMFLPIAAGLINIILFIALFLTLQTGLRLVSHTEDVISRSRELVNIAVDMQAGLRGYLLTGDEEFLQVYEKAKPALATGLVELQEMVSESRVQLERLQRVDLSGKEWLAYAENVLALQRNGEDFSELVRTQGRTEFADFRREIFEFKNHERNVLAQDRKSVV